MAMKAGSNGIARIFGVAVLVVAWLHRQIIYQARWPRGKQVA